MRRRSIAFLPLRGARPALADRRDGRLLGFEQAAVAREPGVEARLAGRGRREGRALGGGEDAAREERFERLRKWRIHKSLQKKMPVYTILQQKALIGIANSKPTTIKELLAIPYIGKKTAEEYGEEILSLVENTKS